VIGCAAARDWMGPWLDGELVGDDAQALEAHLVGCPACRAALEEERALHDAIRGAVSPEPAPAELRARILALARTTTHRRGGRRWIAAAAAAVLLAAGSGVWLGRQEAVAPDLVRRAADNHLRYARGQLPLEVRSRKGEDVSRWFSGRLPFHLVLPEYPSLPGEEKPYVLEGGRLVSVGDEYAAYVAYRLDDQPISLLVTSADRVLPSGGDVVTQGNLRFHVVSRAGLQVITWTDKGLTYALASDVSVDAARSCLVCHGSPAERRKLDGFRTPRT
jgi:anti-sigma factor (TIGR02949 family)